MSLSSKIRNNTLKKPVKRAVEVKEPLEEGSTQGRPVMFNEGGLLDEKLNQLSEGLAEILGDEVIPPLMERKASIFTEEQPISVRGARVMENIEEPEPEVKFGYHQSRREPLRHYLFVSDQAISPAIKCHIDSFNMLKSYNSNFVNRTCEDLLRAGVNHIWVNISDSKARGWLELNLLNRSNMIAVLVYSSTKYSKWLEDVEKHCDIKSKLSNLKKLNSLSLEDMMNQLATKIDVHSPPSRCSPLLSLIGCSTNVKKKNPIAY